MSLINEALKKAQNQRTVDLTSAPSSVPAALGSGTSQPVRIAKRPPPLAARTLMGLLGGGLVGLLAVGGVSFFYFSASPEQPAATKTKPPQPSPAVTVASLPPPLPVAITPPPPIISVALPPIPSPATTGVAPAGASKPPAAPPAPMPATPTTNPKISEFVEALRISVVRLTPTDPKVVLNGQVFRLNDVVDRNLQVRLVKIEPSRLVFTDANGFNYTKAH